MILYNRQLESKTLTVYLTNVLFTATKLTNIRSIVYTDSNIFYSAYMTRKVQYNDIDSDVYDLDKDNMNEECKNEENEENKEISDIVTEV